MADYNIYIHSLNDGGTAGGTPTFNPTTPWGSQESGASSGGEQETSKNSPNFLAEAKSAMKIAKAVPWIAAAVAVIKTAYSITKTVSEFQAIQTGDYRLVTAFENYESMKNALFHPVSTTIQTLKSQKLNKIENQRREMQRELLGDSEINRYSNRGY